MATKSSTFSSVISGSPMITSEKLVGSENYLSWSASVELWFMGQGYEDHLVTQEADIPEVDKVQWRKIDAQLCASSIVNVRQQDMDLSTYIGQIASLKEEFLTVMPLTTDVGDQRIQIDKFFMVLTLIGLRPDLETVRDQILGSSSVPSLDDVFARLLRISSTQTLPSDNTSDSSVLVSQTNSRGGRSGNRGRGQRPHCTYCNKLGHTRDRWFSSLTVSMTTISAIRPPSQLLFSVAQTGNASACLTHTSSLGPWILDSGASDHISGNKDLFSSITTTSALPTVTLANGSQTMAKGFGFAHLSLPYLSILSFMPLSDRSTGKTIGIGRESQGLYHLTSPSPAVCISTDAPLLIHSRLGHPSLSKFQKMVPSFSSLSSLACESCQLGKHTRVSFPKRLNNRAKSPFELVHTDVWGPCRTASTLGFQYFVTFIDDYSRLTMPGNIFLHHLLHLCPNMGSFISLLVLILLNKMGTNFLPEPQNASSWDIPDFKRVIVVIPLRLIATFSPLMSLSLRTHRFSPPLSLFFVSEVLPLPIISPPDAVPSRPLQVYHRRHRVASSFFGRVPADSPPIPSASPAPALPPSADLPIALRKGWRQAMVDEMAALHSNGTWDLVVLPSGKSTVGCRWVYTVKVGPDGQVDRLKARLVAKGYTQVYGSDYGDTFSPVAKIASVRLLLSMAAMRSWPLYQLDIKNVFLHGDLAEEVYMEQPPGFVAQGESGLVCRLRRSLYGLKQSPRAWFSRFSSVVQEFGMFRSTADHSVFYHHNSSGQCIYLVVYVDDIVITGSDQNGIQNLKQHLFTHFQTKDLGKLKYFLGIEIAQSSSGVVLSQRKYALDILEETGMLDCKPVDTPMDPNVKLIPGQGEPLGDPGRYRRLVGKLNYLTITRPDISFPVSVVSQFLQSPCDSHWDAVIRILRYIKSTPGQGVLYENRGHTQVVGYTDADWAGSPTDRRSTSGYCVFIGGNLISWKSKKQDVVARSSAEAEYRAMALATCELIWLKHLLRELRFGKDEQMKLICDNQAALHIASNPVFHERTKHIEVDCHFIREKIASGCVRLVLSIQMIN
ncbi:Retrovirus-related Pol polyprotein from transposon RE1 [Vitis vinifera]|uniref:Retrovirus-related Pol polyprotein from transposon RE1 n=1 Tax=Vitis vinifera TaxID=29760 RepID=A0A438ISL1_VITVI|nr:Retrovirus-related Pol polyprotein from transposon RE1 [Vitis vinifera]